MTDAGPTSRPPHFGPDDDAGLAPGGAPAPSSALQRANRMSAANMIRSLLPLVVICLLVVGFSGWLRTGDPVREIDPTSTVRLAADRAAYPLPVPTDLPEGYRPTSARTDAGGAADGAPVTLEIGYVTPTVEYAGFVVSDDARARPLRTILDDAQERGSIDIAGRRWTRSTTARGETALSRADGGVTVVVTGSASDRELQTVAAAVRPYSG